MLAGDTQLVIDGFTRSAVTFAVVAFQLAQNDHVRVAHHLHAAAHVIEAARRGVPALVSVRAPEDSVLSAVIREPLVGPRRFLHSYVDFHERLRPYRSAFVIGTFEEATSNFGAVTRAVNARFHTDFREFEHTDASVARCFDLIEERSSRPPWEPLLGKFLSGRMSLDEYVDATAEARSRLKRRAVPESRVQRPSEVRLARKAELRAIYLRPELAFLRARAEAAYAALTERS